MALKSFFSLFSTLLLLFLTTTIPLTTSETTDLTKVLGQEDFKIAETVEEIIRSWCLLPDFRYLIKFIPYLIYYDMDAKEVKPFEPPNYKGLWKIDEEQFNYVKSKLDGELLEEINRRLPKKWSSIEWKDAEIPIIGGTVAALVLYYRSDKLPHVPANPFLQSTFLKTYYRKAMISNEFRIPQIDEDLVKPEGKLDVLFMLDSTKKISNNAFVTIKWVLTGAANNLMKKPDLASFYPRVAVKQYDDTFQSEIAFTGKDKREEVLRKIKEIVQKKKDVVARASDAMKEIIGTFETEEKLGVSRVAVLVMPGFSKTDEEETKKIRNDLRKKHINLVVIPADVQSKEENVRMGELEDARCPMEYLREGINEGHDIYGYLIWKILEHNFFWFPAEKADNFNLPPLTNGLKCMIETGKGGVTMKIKIEKTNPTDNLKADLYLSPDRISASPVYFEKHVVMEVGKETIVFVPDNAFSEKSGGVSCFLRVHVNQGDLSVAFSSAAGRDCTTDPCLNAGECVDETSLSYRCQCMPGFEGLNCEVKIDGCTNKPCKNNGKCIAGSDSKSYKCECPENFSGTICETGKKVEADACWGNKCSEEQECIVLDGMRHKCQCKIAFTGENCQVKVQWCSQVTCKNGGTCVQKGGMVSCQCAANFEGSDCSMVKSGASQVVSVTLLSVGLAFVAVLLCGRGI